MNNLIISRFLLQIFVQFFIWTKRSKSSKKGKHKILRRDLLLISCSRLKQLKIPMLIPRSYVAGYFVNFWGYLGRDNFAQRIS